MSTSTQTRSRRPNRERNPPGKLTTLDKLFHHELKDLYDEDSARLLDLTLDEEEGTDSAAATGCRAVPLYSTLFRLPPTR